MRRSLETPVLCLPYFGAFRFLDIPVVRRTQAGDIYAGCVGSSGTLWAW